MLISLQLSLRMCIMARYLFVFVCFLVIVKLVFKTICRDASERKALSSLYIFLFYFVVFAPLKLY